MNESEIIKTEEEYLAKVYRRFPIVAVRGKEATIWDINGKEYVDCMGGYGVALVGHSNPKVVDAIVEQSKKLITCHPSLYNDARANLLERLVKIAPKGLTSVFLSNSGAEAIETAIKVAVKHTGRKKIISMTGGFHGKTLGALSLTWNQRYRKSFESMLYPNVKFAKFGNVESLKNELDNEVAAVVTEPIQGETGIILPSNDYLKQVRELTSSNGSLLIVDEIQSGLGRTGKMWAHMHWNIEPDIVTVAKGLGGGVPIAATLARPEVMNSLNVGEHSSTFGGNPLSCAAASAVIDFILEQDLPRRAEELGTYFINKLRMLHDESKYVREVRGLGLMIGVEMKFNIHEFLNRLLDKGVIPLYSSINIVRMLPPLVIRKEQLDFVYSKIRETLSERDWLQTKKA
ncbi:MAG: aspartate aminotransferase family protein [Thermoproteota archaeon]|nr:aspartate aminotransferase family protein [Candidatus Brockarchaeota archaeon]MBO3768752.1 aspartate aminotransferase family protein [Candidatus Brockarchaeota archaeon]MBO3801473.1 aspartate aminotransferase family protein [Candidatus Brockarchaeota archaeon]